MRQGRERLLGIGFKGYAAEPLKGFDFGLALLAPVFVDGALCLGTAVLGVDQHPALPPLG